MNTFYIHCIVPKVCLLLLYMNLQCNRIGKTCGLAVEKRKNSNEVIDDATDIHTVYRANSGMVTYNTHLCEGNHCHKRLPRKTQQFKGDGEERFEVLSRLTLFRLKRTTYCMGMANILVSNIKRMFSSSYLSVRREDKGEKSVSTSRNAAVNFK